jgi:hypothetical protein
MHSAIDDQGAFLLYGSLCERLQRLPAGQRPNHPVIRHAARDDFEFCRQYDACSAGPIRRRQAAGSRRRARCMPLSVRIFRWRLTALRGVAQVSPSSSL